MSELPHPHGSWPSPISAGDVARGIRRMAFPSVAGDEVWWEEDRPEEGGRTTLMHRDGTGTVTDLLPAPWSVGTRVHEYGGRSHLPVPRRDDKALVRMGVAFASGHDQRLYLLDRGSRTPVPLTPEPEVERGLRYADPALSADGKSLVCVCEEHPVGGGAPRRSIVTVPLSGRGSSEPTSIVELTSGSDFYASPTPSPDGTHLAYVRWNHPRMPWDGTELRVGTLTGGTLSDEYTIKGGVDESVVSPAWVDAGTLYVASDWPGFWNLYQAGLTGQPIALYPAEEEFHAPPARLGHRSFQVLDSGRVVALHGEGDLTPSVYDPDTLDLEPVRTELTTWSQLHSDGRTAVAVASSPTTPPCLVRIDPEASTVEVLHRSMQDPPEQGLLSLPREQTMTGRYGAPVHVRIHPPTNPDVDSDGPAPFVVWAHGGPVSHSTSEFDLVKAYFTSRGIGVADVNYGGSTGYGRSYRKRLHKQWGVVDVEDCAAVARALVDGGEADPERLAVRGPSAGGFTALLALAGDTFACGVSLFGVTDLLGFAEGTHDFESRFLDTLVGPLPGFEESHRERSPVNRVGDIDVPVLLLQGLEDKVVTPDQATAMARGLGERGVEHALLEFEGEGHGFAGAEARTRALEAELGFYAAVFGFEADVPALELTTSPPETPAGAGTGATEPASDGTGADAPAADGSPGTTQAPADREATAEPAEPDSAGSPQPGSDPTRT
ncbi:prolyl oligopeptidase family serine peptidase [Nocardiopsis sp. HNM0947]|uniref:Prolyl oligopeptidase family serine peptidase n=1 Tax=Nocardiopsis coralli TaxID=2772213 RepID=A0ABR9PC62_9ACTN|nr:prolyl oligopeptidase family serine peptidase [Nocardiopsis coralli]MBE3001426.1 prolyl oligopeptidase family serine peptidase [Nocardiopsis coralli]